MKKWIEDFLLKLAGRNNMDIFEWLRISAVLPNVNGKLLDIGCGYNNLVKRYKGKGTGIDVYNWGSKPDVVVDNTKELPFPDSSFDTITLIACLNHIPYRLDTLKECYRLLTPKGRVLITMIDPFIGKIAHYFDGKDELERGFVEGEMLGMTYKQIQELAGAAGFIITGQKWIYGLPNRLYILTKI